VAGTAFGVWPVKELLVMLRIRLRRTGKKKQPSYRVVVADSRAPRDGDFVETIGLYDPLTDPPTIRIDDEKAKRWLSNGAKPSETVAKLMQRQGILPKQERAAVSAGPKAEAEA
jgi:small subunit ribosomal protein S16